MTAIFKPAIVIEELGELGRLPDGGIINAGGVQGPYFSIGGQPVMLADGSASDGSGPATSTGPSGYEHIQTTADMTWVVTHNRNTRRVQITIWDEGDEQVHASSVKIINSNTIAIQFGTAAIGRAILILF